MITPREFLHGLDNEYHRLKKLGVPVDGKRLINWAFDNIEKVDTSSMSYPLEKYAEALEAMSEEPDFDLFTGKDPFEHAKQVHWVRGMRCGYKRAAEMLRSNPMTLFTIYPDHFPDPEEEKDDKSD